MKKFEYKVIGNWSNLTIQMMDKKLNALGEEGWELVSAQEHVYIFKKKIYSHTYSGPY